MKKISNRRTSLLIPALLLMMGGMASCNKSTTTVDDEITVTISNVAVKNFSLKTDSKVMANLDSVFFSIDLNNGVIFNADSLPKGTKINKLIPVITFASTVSKAEISMTGGSEEEKTVNYLENANDSIDFTRDVRLNVTAADGTNTYSYRIKVNVHKLDSDSLIWDRLSMTQLPSRFENPVEQKSVERGGTVYTLIEENDGSHTWATTESIAAGEWEKGELTLGFVPDVRSLAVTSDSFWILDEDGNLYESADGEEWISTGEKWVTLIGPYTGHVLGVKEAGGTLTHCHYPASDNISDPEMDPAFPIYNRSAFRTIETEWAGDPTAFFVGGETAQGEISDHTWAFDGTTWATIDNQSTPALEGATLFKYTVYRKTSNSFKQIAYDAWIVMGGLLENGDRNRTAYISFDNGVTWRAGSDAMSMPEAFPGLSGADAVVLYSPLEADLADAWKKVATKGMPTRAGISYETDGFDITWQCPYFYMIGGVKDSGKLSDSIWRGVLARLTFTPII